MSHTTRKYSYDGMCEELALYFLHPRHAKSVPGASVKDLAQDIQDAVENFFAAHSSDDLSVAQSEGK